MRILIATPEAVPFAKTGGLADVCGALPRALKALGHDVRIIMPRYECIDARKFGLETVQKEMVVHFPGNWRNGTILEAQFPDSDIPVYFVDQDYYYGREGLYGENGTDYPDNAERFAFFCMSAIWTLKGIDWCPDVIQCNDWQSALIPTYLSNLSILRNDPFFVSVRTLYTIHNLAYQGSFDSNVLPHIGLNYNVYHPEGLEFYGSANLMKAGIVYADALSTVSRQYSEEIKTQEFGCGFEGILRARADRLHGILNGIDYGVWNPETDANLPAQYSPGELSGKAKCKEALQKENGLPVDSSTPLIGIISRLDRQKGFDLLDECLDDIFALGTQMVVLGTGDPVYHKMLEQAAAKHVEQLAVNLTFDNSMAHRIEAGSDIFLMPSRYEPCGLNQLYSLKYGTVPVVRKTGGLADSILDATPKSVKSGKGTGFVFEDYKAAELVAAVKRAVDLFTSNQKSWHALILNGMRQDYSWDRSAREYELLFNKMCAR